MTKRLWLLCAVVILLLPIVGHAQPCTGDDCALLSAVGVATVKPTGPAAKVSSAIRQALSQPEQRGQGPTTSELQGGGLSTDAARMNRAGEVQVYVELVEYRPEYVAQLESLGLRLGISLPQFRSIQGWLPIGAVDAVAALDFVKDVRQPDYGHRNSVGAASTAGDSILRADTARQAFGVSGSGVKVGIISDVVTSLVDSQNSGDLPFVEVLKAGRIGRQ